MLHNQLKYGDSFDIVDVAGIWPCGAELAQPPLAEIEAAVARSEAAVPDMPGAAGAFMVAVYAALMAAFALTMATGGAATFAIVISAFYVAMFFAVPAIFFGVESDQSRRPNLTEFLERGMDTATGHISGASALVQMLVVPALLTIAILAMGIIGFIYL